MVKERDDVCPSAFPLKFQHANPYESVVPADMLGSVIPWLKTIQ